jgi:hypothetical protein
VRHEIARGARSKPRVNDIKKYILERCKRGPLSALQARRPRLQRCQKCPQVKWNYYIEKEDVLIFQSLFYPCLSAEKFWGFFGFLLEISIDH